MKKAEEYLQQFKILRSNYKEGEPFPFNLTRDAHIGSYRDILKAIKQAQLDAIEETVKRCAEEVETEEYPYMDGCETCGHTATYVNKKSILNVAEQLKKEIE